MPSDTTPHSELILPPLSPLLVGRPYAAIPHLAAYASQHGHRDVRQIDLNTPYVRHVIRAALTEQSAGGHTRFEPGAGPDGLPQAVDEAVVAAVVARLGSASDDDPMWAAAARDPAVTPWMFRRAGLPAASAPDDLDGAFAMVGALTDMRQFFLAHYRGAAMPPLVGISVPFATQLAPALLLADVLHQVAGDGVRVILGGPLMTLFTEAQVTALLRRSAVSGVVQHEGEDAFVRLHECPSWDGHSLGEIPHLSYRIGDEVAVNRHAGNRVPLTATRPHGLDPQYVAQAVELPVIVGRGCFYHCSFCDYIRLYERTDFRPVHEVVELVRLAARQSTTDMLHLVYEVMSLPYQRRLVKALAEAGLGIRWRGFQRVYPDLTREDVRRLEASGCRRLDVGLESADDAALRRMNKGYTRAEAGRFLDAFRGTSIQLLLNIIVDYPGLSYERAREAARFLGEVTDGIDNVHFEVVRFMLGRTSEMYLNAETFGLTLVPEAAGVRQLRSPTEAAFVCEESMGECEVREIEAMYRDLNTRPARRRTARVNGRCVDSGSVWVANEPIVVTGRVTSTDIAVRRLSTAETFLIPQQYRPMLEYVAARSEAAKLSAVAAATPVRVASIRQDECADVLSAIGLLCGEAPGLQRDRT